MDAKRITNADFLVGLATLVFCGVWIHMGMQFPSGTQDGVPGCGTFPILVSSVLAAMGLALLIRGYVRPNVFFGFTRLARDNALAIMGTFVVLVLYLLAWYHAGYVTATLFMTLALGFLYRIRWRANVVFALAFTLATYYVFGQFFMIYMELH